MKQDKGFRTGHDESAEDALKKAVKLPPIKKSGKERHHLYSELEEDGELELDYRKHESILDYFDDGEDAEIEDYDDENSEGEEYYDDDNLEVDD